MQFHIGNLINKKIGEAGIKKAELGRRINRSRQTVYNIIRRKTIDTELLYSISCALGYDFFAHFAVRLGDQVSIEQPTEFNTLRLQVKNLLAENAGLKLDKKRLNEDLETHKNFVKIMLLKNEIKTDLDPPGV